MQLSDVTIQPLIFTLLFVYIFGSGIPIPGGGSYVNYVLAGILALNLVSSTMGTAVGLSTDLHEGMIDRFRTLPMWRSADRRLTTTDVTAVGAVEVAVHGWDVAQACGSRQPIPQALAAGILEILPLVATSAARELCFAAPVTVSPLSSPGDLLIALLGRDPQGRIAAQTR
jgi:ABC-2 type transport system permease protein